MLNENDLWLECQESDDCIVVLELCKLIDCMVHDVQHLRAECVRTRYQLSEHLDPIEAEALKLDILSDLGADYEGDAYDLYKTVMYAGGDPLAFKEWLDSIQALAKGNDDHEY